VPRFNDSKHVVLQAILMEWAMPPNRGTRRWFRFPVDWRLRPWVSRLRGQLDPDPTRS